MKETRPAIPGHGTGHCRHPRRHRRPYLDVRHRDEGAALIAALASAPAGHHAPQSGEPLRTSEHGGWRRARVRDGRPSGARRWAFDSGSTRSATARPRRVGTRPIPCLLFKLRACAARPTANASRPSSDTARRSASTASPDHHRLLQVPSQGRSLWRPRSAQTRMVTTQARQVPRPRLFATHWIRQPLLHYLLDPRAGYAKTAQHMARDHFRIIF